MHINRIFINTYRYDFDHAKICIASIRYWYPDIPIYLIKDYGKGDPLSRKAERWWNIKTLKLTRKKFNWGYGKLEPLFLDSNECFLILDADTVITGPVLDIVANIESDFVVDDEVQSKERFNEIYYNLDRINEIEDTFIYPGYSFNTGQWFGKTGVLERKDFELTLNWSDPPSTKYPQIIFNNDQTHLNFVIHLYEQQNKLKVTRLKLMIWPKLGNADFIDLNNIKKKEGSYPFVIHWAGMKFNSITSYPRADILLFYRNYFYSNQSQITKKIDFFIAAYLRIENKVKNFFKSKFLS
ncbi:hypothetical protein [Haliscomenobacter sp.]|uniref:hypothetical protein n=1 Tax=Haliscomenobacter sp. TaxID=2717303 RepID=UPI003BA9E4D8